MNNIDNFGPGFDSDALRRDYNSTEGAVAYVDESYSLPKNARGKTFYILSATILERSVLQSFRNQFLSVAGGTYWHTREAVVTESGRAKILAFSRLLATVPNIVSIQSPVELNDPDGEMARKRCFTFLMKCLFAEHLNVRALVVIEKRNDKRGVDTETMAELRLAGAIPTQAIIAQCSPANECLLWGPDVISWATNRMMQKEENMYIAPVSHARNYQVINVT